MYLVNVHADVNQKKSRLVNHCISSWMLFMIAVISTASVDHEVRAGDIKAGVDLWVTPAGASYDVTPIPAGFFTCLSGASSQVYTAGICMQGNPIVTDPPNAIFPTDTIVERKADAVFPPGDCPASATVPIEIVALSLVSCGPITITCDDGSVELWNVGVCLDPIQPIGSMTIRHECTNGGSYDASLPVLPLFTFTRQADRHQQFYTPPTALNFSSTGQWSHSDLGFLLSLPAGTLVDNDCDGQPETLSIGSTLLPDGFFPGQVSLDCTCDDLKGGTFQKAGLTPEQALLAAHGVFVANQEKPQTVGACCVQGAACQMTSPTQCAGQYLGDGIQCSPDPCFGGSLCGDAICQADETFCTCPIDCPSSGIDCNDNGIPDECDPDAPNCCGTCTGGAACSVDAGCPVGETCDTTGCDTGSCPLGSSFCQSFTADCVGDATQVCVPHLVNGTSQGPVVGECFCAPGGDGECGAIQIDTDPLSGQIVGLACPGSCLDSNAICEVHLDGVGIGTNAIAASDLQAGQTMTCECPPVPLPQPDPHITLQGTSATFGSADVPGIPADFFDPGSDPFVSTVNLVGGPNDTLGQRDGLIVCPGIGPCDPIGVELIELSLVSAAPITVTFNGGLNPELWDVAVDLSPTGSPQLGTMDATLTHANGGTYDAHIPFSPRFTFTETANPANVKVLDYDVEGILPIEINFVATDWVINLGPGLVGTVITPNDGEFVPGVRENIPGDTNSQVVIQALGNSKGTGISHPVQTPPVVCPLSSPQGVVDSCAARQLQDCININSLDDICLPILAQTNANGGFDAVLCTCITPGSSCGPVDISGGDTISCPGDCVDPDLPPCQIYVDRNDGTGPQPTGLTNATATQFPAGSLFSCDCAPETQGCTNNSDCDDGVVCTDDVCDPTDPAADLNGCVNRPIQNCCTVDADCPDDGDVCTIERCDLTTNQCITVDDPNCAGACCLTDGTCVVVPPTQCNGKFLGGGTPCLGDNDGNGIDDACQTDKCGQCLPGAHWIDGCPPISPDSDTFPTGALLGIDTDFDCIADVSFRLHGPATIGKVGPLDDSIQFPGLSLLDGHKDVIDTEIVAMTLSSGGTVMLAGAGLGAIPLPSSLGAVVEDTIDPTIGDSFFDVMVEISSPLLAVPLYNQTPIRVKEEILCMPPNGRYVHFSGCTPLYDSPNLTVGQVPIANLVSAIHFTFPDCCIPDGVQGKHCSCVPLPPAECEAAGGFPSNCLGDSDGDMCNDACNPPTSLCPEPAGQDWCAQLQAIDCIPDSTNLQFCLPNSVLWDPAVGPKAISCDCFTEGPECGPVGIQQVTNSDGTVTTRFSCKGICPDGTDNCLIHVNGQNSGVSVVDSALIALGTRVTCECPPPHVCEPNADQSACEPFNCPVAGDNCRPTLISQTRLCFGTTTPCNTSADCNGVFCEITSKVEACDCDSGNNCQLGIDPVTLNPVCNGVCPLDTDNCALFGEDTDGDGVNDQFRCDCATPPECKPNATGTGCEPFVCPDDISGIVTDCQPRCLQVDPLTGVTTVVDCDCRGLNDCHAEPVGAAGTPGAGGIAGAATGNTCVVVDNGTGTITLPPEGCAYLSPDEVHEIIDGLPAGTTIELAAIHKDFICERLQPGDPDFCSIPLPADSCETEGGSLGGNVDCTNSTLELVVTIVESPQDGSTAQAPQPHFVSFDVFFEVHTGLRNSGDAVQDFETEMVSMQGEAPPDALFDQLKIVAGSAFGLPSSGHTTLTRLGPSGSSFQVDSFFDISYQIDYVGALGGALAGLSGTTQGILRMKTGTSPTCVGGCPPDTACVETKTVNADGTIKVCCDCVPITGACCTVDTCTVVSKTVCDDLAGVYLGDNSVCQGDEACCLPDGTCRVMDIVCCELRQGTPQGTATCQGVTCNLDPLCQPTADGTACKQADCSGSGCFGECIGGAYCDDPNCCIVPGSCVCYAPNSKESIKHCGDCFGECINGAYCDATANPDCCIVPGACACYLQNSDISIQLCDDNSCFGTCDANGYCDPVGKPECALNFNAPACYGFGTPEADKLCAQGGPTKPDECLPRCVRYDSLTGKTTITECGCTGGSECHANVPGIGVGAVAIPQGAVACVLADAGGTVNLPPAGCPYVSPDDAHKIIEGLPPGTEIIIGAEHTKFQLTSSGSGGSLGGEFEQFNSLLILTVSSNAGGAIPGFNRTLFVPVQTETHTGPRTPGDPVQDFDTDMFRLQGELFGDPDFCTFRIRGGTDFGLPSPGHTTLTQLPGGNWNVDSFFDVSYEIEFQGCPGSLLEGMSGTTRATVRMKAGATPTCEGLCGSGDTCKRTQTVNADGTIDICCDCCQPVDPPKPEPNPIPKNRYISLIPNNPGRLTSLRVTLVSYPKDPTLVGSQWWIGPPREICENSGQITPPDGGCGQSPGLPTSFMAARLECSPHCMDWGSLGGVIHVGDINIVPGAVYEVETVACDCETAASAALRIPTAQVWGDVDHGCGSPACECDPPNGVVDIVRDVTDILSKFSNLDCALSKVRADIEPAIIDLKINFTDVTLDLAAFQQAPYPFSDPLGCPGG